VNILYDRVIPDNRPRLYVMLDLEEHVRKFTRGAWFNYDPTIQDEILGHFRSLIRQQRRRREFDIKGLFVVFGSVEHIARMEANDRVPEEEIQALQERLNNPDLWLIRPSFDSVVFFFYTELQAKRYERKGLKDVYAREYGQLVDPYDPLGYLQRRGISVRFESKEGFNKKFHGSWFGYDHS
jgi:hypothetical protein